MMAGTINRLNVQASCLAGPWRSFTDAQKQAAAIAAGPNFAQRVVCRMDDAILGTHHRVDVWLEASFGTGQRPEAADPLRPKHRGNPGTVDRGNPLQSAIVAACFAPAIAAAYLPVAWALGFGASTTLFGFTLAAAAVAAALQAGQAQAGTAPLLEDAAGIVTAGAKAAVTLMAGLAGLWFGLFQWVNATAGWAPLGTVPGQRR